MENRDLGLRVLRSVDDKNRITIPESVANQVGLKPKSKVVVTYNRDRKEIILEILEDK